MSSAIMRLSIDRSCNRVLNFNAWSIKSKMQLQTLPTVRYSWFIPSDTRRTFRGEILYGIRSKTQIRKSQNSMSTTSQLISITIVPLVEISVKSDR